MDFQINERFRVKRALSNENHCRFLGLLGNLTLYLSLESKKLFKFLRQSQIQEIKTGCELQVFLSIESPFAFILAC